MSEFAEANVGTRRCAARVSSRGRQGKKQHDRIRAEKVTSCEKGTEDIGRRSRFHAQWAGETDDTGQKSETRAGRREHFVLFQVV